VIGDKPTDIAAATAADLPGFLFPGGDLSVFIEDVLLKTA
jgi:D-glycero-D-manno-heptose 1,7-bisphosphate phosphatase